MGEAAKFLGALFSDALEDPRASVVVWGPKLGASFHRTAGGAATALEMASADVYFACCTHDVEAIKAAGSKRGTSDTTRHLVAVWADIDVAGSGHSGKKPYPTSVVDARELLRTALPLEPTCVVSTGGGLHVWWLLKEPWLLESEADRAEAQKLVQGVQTRIREIWQTRGWTIDSTFDLARVLRTPGTMNKKYEPPRDVCLLDFDDDRRYDPSDLAEWCAEEKQPALIPSQTIERGVSITVDPNVTPNADKLAALQALDARFAATWARRRPDLGDVSQSGYDMALASLSIGFGWSDQEATDLLIAHRRAGGKGAKALAYYERTIRKAHHSGDAERAQDDIADRVESVDSGDMDATEARGAHLKDLRALLGLELLGIQKFPGEPPTFRLVLEQGAIGLGTVRSILEPRPFREAVAAVTGTAIRRFKAAQWDPIAQGLLQACETLDVGELSSPEETVRDWLRGYLNHSGPVDDRTLALSQHQPHQSGSNLYVTLTGMRRFLRYELDEQIGCRQLGAMLRGCGARPKALTWKTPQGRSTSASVWEVAALATNGSVALKGRAHARA